MRITRDQSVLDHLRKSVVTSATKDKPVLDQYA